MQGLNSNNIKVLCQLFLGPNSSEDLVVLLLEGRYCCHRGDRSLQVVQRDKKKTHSTPGVALTTVDLTPYPTCIPRYLPTNKHPGNAVSLLTCLMLRSISLYLV